MPEGIHTLPQYCHCPSSLARSELHIQRIFRPIRKHLLMLMIAFRIPDFISAYHMDIIVP
jgi:hypothetical protein